MQTQTPDRLASATVVRAKDLDRGLLIAAGLELEPVVMLDPVQDGVVVRKLTPDEKVDHGLATEEPIFMGSDEEQEAVFAALDRRADAAG